MLVKPSRSRKKETSNKVVTRGTAYYQTSKVMRPTVYTTALHYDDQLFWQDRERVFLVVQPLLGNA